MFKVVPVLVIASAVTFGWKEPKPERPLKDAGETFQEVMSAPDKAIPQTLLGSFGTQLGVEAMDVVMLVMNKRGVERLLSDKFTIGAEAAAAAGTIGRQASADTDVLMTAEILSGSRSRGVFAGVSLNGTVVQIDKKDNAKLIGKPLTSNEILEGTTPIPSSAKVLTSVLEKYAAPQPHRSRSAGAR